VSFTVRERINAYLLTEEGEYDALDPTVKSNFQVSSRIYVLFRTKKFNVPILHNLPKCYKNIVLIISVLKIKNKT